MTEFKRGFIWLADATKKCDDAQRHIADRDERLVRVTTTYFRDGRTYRHSQTFGEAQWDEAHRRLTSQGGVAEQAKTLLHDRHLAWRRKVARRARRG